MLVVMIVVYNVVIIVALTVTLVRCYPEAVSAWIASLFVALDEWLDRQADATLNRRRERAEQLERQIAQWDEQRAVLRWMQVVLLTSSVAEPDEEPFDRSL